MNSETVVAIVAFATVMSITPGPNNIMLMASGTNFGFRRTIPHILGVNLGFSFMLTMVGIGLTKVFELFPVVRTILQVLCIGYLLFLSYKIATAAPSPNEASTTRESHPMTFLQAVLFQWVNPKAWSMAMTAVSVYSPSGTMKDVLPMAALFCMANLPCICTWVVLGQQVRRFLANNRRLRVFNFTMAGLLVGSLVFLLR